MGKSNEVATLGISGQAAQSRLRAIFNPDTGAFLGRTAKSWVLITLFYTVYYACLAAFFGGMLSVFLFSVITDDRPHLTGQQSLLKLNPGMGYRPQPDPESGLITFTAGYNETYFRYVQNLMSLYNNSKKLISQANLRDSCAPNATDPDPSKVCPFDWDNEMRGCVPDNQFGYAVGKPCVVLKLNRVFGWVPDPMDPATPHPTVRCFGENAADAENLGPLTFQPTTNGSAPSAGYFSNVYFPYLNQHEYRAPFVAVIFEKLPYNTLVMVECRLGNLRGVYYDKMDRDAMVRFDIFMRN